MPTLTKKGSTRAPNKRAPAKRPTQASHASAPSFSPAAAAFIPAAVADGLAIQHRFKAEPIYARTGKGYMASSGVSEIAAHATRTA